MKIRIFIPLILTLVHGFTAKGEPTQLEAKIANIPNVLPLRTMDTAETRACLCGFTLLDFAPYGHSHLLYKLAQVDFNANLLYQAYNFPAQTDTNVNTDIVNRTAWFGVPDPTWVSMKMPAALMKYILSGFFKMMDENGFKAKDSDIECKPAVSYLGDDIGIISLILKKNKDRDDIIKSLSFDDIHTLPQNNNRWYGGKGNVNTKGLPAASGVAVVCNLSFIEMFGNQEVPRKSAYVFRSTMGSHSFGYAKSHITVDESNPYVTLANIKAMMPHMEWKATSLATTHSAFAFKEDYDSNKEDLSGVLHIPNRFQFEFCTGLLKEIKDGLYLNANNFYKAYDKYSQSCPILAHNLPIHLPSKPPITYNPMFKWTISKGTKIGTKITSKLAKYKVTNYQPMTFDVPENGLFEPNGDYDSQLDERLKEREDKIAKLKEEFDNLQPKVIEENETPENEKIKKFNEEKMEILKTELQEIHDKSSVAGSAETNQDNKEEENFVPESLPDPKKNQQVQLDISSMMKSADCEEGIKELEIRVQGYIPATEEQVIDLIIQFLKHPHIGDCTELEKITFNENKINLNSPFGLVLELRVSKLTPEELKHQNQETEGAVFEIYFFNHNFDEQKNTLFYSPASEIVNEWDRFTQILLAFIKFAEQNLENSLTPHDLTTAFLSKATSKLNPPNTRIWTLDVGPTGPMHLSSTSTSEKTKQVFSRKELNYIFHVLRLTNTQQKDNIPDDFYDILYQAWNIGENYIMVKMQGTKLSYQIIVNRYANEDKIDNVIISMVSALRNTYMNNSESVVSLKQTKKIIHDSLLSQAKSDAFTWTMQANPIPLDHIDKNISQSAQNEEMWKNDDTEFMFNFYVKELQHSFILRGMVHVMESLPVVNLHFTTDLFVSEYIIPLDKQASFQKNVFSAINESYYHFHLMVYETELVQSSSTTDEQLKEAQELGHYSFNTVLMKVLEIMKEKDVYGCISEYDKPESESGENGDAEVKEKRYKWSKPKEWDRTGIFVMLRSNKLFENDPQSRCEPNETTNPLLMDLHSTYIDEQPGYALTINNLDNEGQKDVKTTYHFVQYQDYAHQRVFEHYITGIMNSLFHNKGEAEKEGEGE